MSQNDEQRLHELLQYAVMCEIAHKKEQPAYETAYELDPEYDHSSLSLIFAEDQLQEEAHELLKKLYPGEIFSTANGYYSIKIFDNELIADIKQHFATEEYHRYTVNEVDNTGSEGSQQETLKQVSRVLEDIRESIASGQAFDDHVEKTHMAREVERMMGYAVVKLHLDNDTNGIEVEFPEAAYAQRLFQLLSDACPDATIDWCYDQRNKIATVTTDDQEVIETFLSDFAHGSHALIECDWRNHTDVIPPEYGDGRLVPHDKKEEFHKWLASEEGTRSAPVTRDAWERLDESEAAFEQVRTNWLNRN